MTLQSRSVPDERGSRASQSRTNASSPADTSGDEQT